jgi:hypothetical protein
MVQVLSVLDIHDMAFAYIRRRLLDGQASDLVQSELNHWLELPFAAPALVKGHAAAPDQEQAHGE